MHHHIAGAHLGKFLGGVGGKSMFEDILWGRVYSEQYSMLKG